MATISRKARLLKRWEAIRSSFWFVPALMAAAAVALALAALTLDRGGLGAWKAWQDAGYGGSAEGAATMLQTIATSMITIAGVVFSLTLVCLSLASTQFGPRLLRSFMRDAVNQVVLGTFVATFLYCILVLRAVRRADEVLFVPHLSVAVAVLLAVASLAVLVFFIHHVARSIQAEALIARVAAELHEGIDRLFPERLGDDAAGAEPPSPPAGPAAAIAAREDGYVQIIDAPALLWASRDADIVLRIRRRPGDYVMEGEPLALAAPPERVSAGVRDRIAGAFAIGSERTPAQDVAFILMQLVDIALRALSPSLNDPFTAASCIDRIGSALRRLALRELPPVHRRDEHGAIRVIAPRLDLAQFAALGLDPIRRHARDEPIVLARMVAMISNVAPFVRRPEDREALRAHAAAVRDAARDLEAADRAGIEEAAAAALARLGQSSAGREEQGTASSRKE
jgi:uncharacterized membrane protein